jgi:hypothetical protein
MGFPLFDHAGFVAAMNLPPEYSHNCPIPELRTFCGVVTLDPKPPLIKENFND